MKGGLVAAAAAVLAGGVSASAGHRHAHQMFKKHAGSGEVCLPTCSTVWTTITGQPTLVPGPTYVPPPATTTVVVVPLPTPEVHTCPTPGTYTFPATTITVSETTTVCGATSTYVPPGTHTVGGVTTIVETATTVTCPYATVSTSGTVTTSTIMQTTYVCPTPGTYTVAPTTTTVTESTTLTYVVPTTICPGTYTHPEQVVTVTETDYVYVCPYTSSGLPTTTAAPAPPPTYAPPPVYAQPKPSAPAYHPPSPGGGLTSSNDHYGITYTPYESETGNCKSSSEVDSDISALKNAGFNVVRVYGTDCNTLEYVGGACEKYGMDMITGVFVKSSGCSPNTPDIKTQIDQLSAWAKWDMVRLMVVGNEAIMNGYCSASDLAALISAVKSSCSSYKGPYTISETLDVWQRSDVASTICGCVDVTGANIHPFFNPNVTPSTAGQFVAGQLEILSDICPGNEVINLECGWPTGGNCNGAACPGESEQAEAISSIRAACGHQTVFFSADNDNWKSDATPCQCEKTWGCKSLFGI